MVKTGRSRPPANPPTDPRRMAGRRQGKDYSLTSAYSALEHLQCSRCARAYDASQITALAITGAERGFLLLRGAAAGLL